ncbi:MAG: ribonuclease Z [Bacteroidales bacterium]|nr:ribonuclease Z [Bacteroidales bacterium]
MAEKINLMFLGTGSSIPTVRRNHPAVFLSYKDENILFDCGEGTQRQFRKAHVNPCKITKLLITHWHADHVLGIPGLIQTLILNGYNKTLEVYGPRGTKKKMGLYLDLFVRKGAEFNIVVKEVSGGVFFDSEEFYLEAGDVDHDCPALAYSFVIKDKRRLDRGKLAKAKIPNGPLLGELAKGNSIEVDGKLIKAEDFLYDEKGRKVTFIMDSRRTDSLVSFASGSSLLICESTFSEDEQEIAMTHGHMSCLDAATIAKDSGSEALVLMHLSQRYENIPKVIEKQAKGIFENCRVVEDFYSVEL